jgi:hypothetical protein
MNLVRQLNQVFKTMMRDNRCLLRVWKMGSAALSSSTGHGTPSSRRAFQLAGPIRFNREWTRTNANQNQRPIGPQPESEPPNCTGTTEVQLIRVGGMPHIWPDAADGFNYNANVAVIDFLLTHTRP